MRDGKWNAFISAYGVAATALICVGVWRALVPVVGQGAWASAAHRACHGWDGRVVDGLRDSSGR